MKCFYHQERDAVGMCKSCQRGLCPDCLVDVPPGLACRGRCEADVAAVNLILERSKLAWQKAGLAHGRNAVATLIMGLLFAGLGILAAVTSQNFLALLLVPFGGVFLLWSFFSYRSGKQISEVPAAAPPAGSQR